MAASSAKSAIRTLHYVFKVADRTSTIAFYRDVLGMKVLRHEEFEEGCKASCNGPYDGKWSKTMVGYGAEDNHFVMELTYNYGIKHYKKGNDFKNVTIYSNDVMKRIRGCSYTQQEDGNGAVVVDAPGGYRFRVYSKDTGRTDAVYSVTLGVSDIKRSLRYWRDLLAMQVFSSTDKSVVLGFGESQTRVELVELPEALDRAEAYGRIAFSIQDSELEHYEKKIKDNNYTILTPLVSLDTPGKATVRVVIVADPDGHEICFVGDEAFRELSKVDPKADQLLNEAMAADKSAEWFARQKKK